MAGPGVTKHSRESSHYLTDKATTRATRIYSDKRISEKKTLEKLEIWLLLSHLAEIRTLTLEKIG